jgi:hypothetical protein
MPVLLCPLVEYVTGETNTWLDLHAGGTLQRLRTDRDVMHAHAQLACKLGMHDDSADGATCCWTRTHDRGKLTRWEGTDTCRASFITEMPSTRTMLSRHESPVLLLTQQTHV